MNPGSLLLLAGLLVAGAPAFGQHAPDLPKVWTVHIDQVLPDSQQRFEQLAAAQAKARNRVLAGHGLPTPPTYEISTRDGSYLALRPRESYAELERTLPDSVNALMRRDVSPFSDTIHTFLAIHHSEIWTLDKELSFVPGGFDPLRSTFIHVVVEEIRPPASGVYDSLTAGLYQALRTAGSPCTVLVFYSTYGTGGVRHVWLSDEPLSLPALAARAFGLEGAELFLKRRQAFLVGESREFDALARPELTDLPPGTPWFGIR